MSFAGDERGVELIRRNILRDRMEVEDPELVEPPLSWSFDGAEEDEEWILIWIFSVGEMGRA